VLVGTMMEGDGVPTKPFTGRNMLAVSHLLWTPQTESTPVIPHEKRRYLAIFISAGCRFPFLFGTTISTRCMYDKDRLPRALPSS
jgi:hypothetical protein